jgi:hypothetical protein
MFIELRFCFLSCLILSIPALILIESSRQRLAPCRMYRCLRVCSPQLRWAAPPRIGGLVPAPRSLPHRFRDVRQRWLSGVSFEGPALIRDTSDDPIEVELATKEEVIHTKAAIDSQHDQEDPASSGDHEALIGIPLTYGTTRQRGIFSVDADDVGAILAEAKQGFEFGRHPKLLALGLRLQREINLLGVSCTASLYWSINYNMLRWWDDASSSTDIQNFFAHFTQRSEHYWARVQSTGTRPTSNRLRQTDVLLGSLLTSAEETLSLLYDDSGHSHYPWSVRMDALSWLRNFRWEEVQAHPSHLNKFWDLINLQRDPSTWPPVRMLGHDLDLLLEDLTENGQRELLHVYMQRQDLNDDFILLRLVDYFTRLKDVDTALELLSRVTVPAIRTKDEDVLDENRAPVARRCTNLLLQETVVTNGQSKSFRILPRILQLGVPPTTVMYNVMIYNAVRWKLPDVAWDLVNYVRQMRVPLHVTSCFALMRDAFRRKDAERINEMLSYVQERPEIARDEWVASYMMYMVTSLCVRHQKLGTSETWKRVLNVYDRNWNRGPLVRAGLLDAKEDNAQASGLRDPSPRSLAWTIYCFVTAQRDVAVVDRLWDYITQRLKEDDIELKNAASDCVLFNAFMQFYGRYEDSLPKALGILQGVIEGGWPVATDLTWSLAVGMLLKHRKKKAALQIWHLRLQNDKPLYENSWKQQENYPDTEVAMEIREAFDLEMKRELGSMRPEAKLSDIPETVEQGIEAAMLGEPVPSQTEGGSDLFGETGRSQGQSRPWEWNSAGNLDAIINYAVKNPEIPSMG